MLEEWTAEVIAKMHINGISQKRLAEALGYSPEYVSSILNGKRSPRFAEIVFKKAIDTLCE